MRKNIQLLALLLCVLMMFCSCDITSYLPFGADSTETAETTEAASTTETEATEDSTESSATATTEKTPEPSEPVVKVKIAKIYTADQLFTVLEASKASNYAESSQNTIYQLQCDIDLNEGWSAELTANSKLPAAPSRVWTGIEKFYGTLDGQGHTIRGIYMNEKLEDGESLAFIHELCGGTIKNLTIENSLIAASAPDEVQNAYVGVLIGVVNQPSTVENVHINANVYVEGPETITVSGTVAKVSRNALTETNLTFGGAVTHLTEDPSVIKVGTAEQLLAALAEHGDFADKTLKLTANIDLNPGWDATVTIADKVIFPEAPAVLWPELATFKGTLDGQGYAIKGIYKSMTAKGGTGVCGGMFATFAGTIKNIRIENSFVVASNNDWSSKNVHVGGIAGDVAAGANVIGVYMDIEVWYKSHEGCMLGGAFGCATGAYNVNGFVFAGRVGHTNNSNAVNFTLASGKSMWLGQMTGNQNWKDDTIVTNVAAIGDKFVGAADSAQSGFIGTDLPTWNYKYCYTGKKDDTYSGYQTMVDAGWVWNEYAECMVPRNTNDLVTAAYTQQ